MANHTGGLTQVTAAPSGMTDNPHHSVSVAGIVVREDGRILAIQRRDTCRWEPPGGILELDETFEDGVRREVAEETGMTVEVERLTGAYKNLGRGVVALVFRCRPVGGEATPTEESQRVRWLTRDDITTCMAPAFAVRVLDALTDGAASRAHDGVQLVVP
jgi:ADP-ribose pyrophosphatase YjhB (NUDIX family)